MSKKRQSRVRFEPVESASVERLPRLSPAEREALARENFTPEQRAALAAYRRNRKASARLGNELRAEKNRLKRSA